MAVDGNAIVALAKTFVGWNYVWGGASPSTSFDCSGLPQYVFGMFGISLPRVSSQQYGVGTPVPSLDQAVPGDLIFYDPGTSGAPPGLPGHVAIYAGNGQVVVASNPTDGIRMNGATAEGSIQGIRHMPGVAGGVGSPVGVGSGSVTTGTVSPASFSLGGSGGYTTKLRAVVGGILIITGTGLMLFGIAAVMQYGLGSKVKGLPLPNQVSVTGHTRSMPKVEK